MTRKFLNKESLELISSVEKILKINGCELFIWVNTEIKDDWYSFSIYIDYKGTRTPFLEYSILKSKYNKKEYNDTFKKLMLTRLLYFDFKKIFNNDSK